MDEEDEDVTIVPHGKELLGFTPGRNRNKSAKNKNKMSEMKCIKCKADINSVRDQMQCGICHGRTHNICVDTSGGITAEDLTKMRSKSIKALIYICFHCKRKMPQDTSLLDKEASTMTTRTQRKMQEEINSLKEERDSLRSNYSQMERQLNIIQAQLSGNDAFFQIEDIVTNQDIVAEKFMTAL